MLKLDYDQCVISHRDCDICQGEKKGLYIIGKYDEEDFTYFICMDCLHALILSATMLMDNLSSIEMSVAEKKKKEKEEKDGKIQKNN